MTENINVGDIMAMYDTQSTKKTGSTLSTVLGVIGAIIVLALLWSAYTNSRDKRSQTEAIAAGNDSSNGTAVDILRQEVQVLSKYERQDALKLAYTDGMLFGSCDFYGDDYRNGRHRDGRCGHGHDGGCGCQHQQFREVRKFAETSDDIEVINTCGSLRG